MKIDGNVRKMPWVLAPTLSKTAGAIATIAPIHLGRVSETPIAHQQCFCCLQIEFCGTAVEREGCKTRGQRVTTIIDYRH